MGLARLAVPALLVRDVRAGVVDEEDRDRDAGESDGEGTHPDHRPRREARRERASDERRGRDSEIAGRLVEAEREPFVAAGLARSIFITTVIDQARPWLAPSRTFAATIQPQLGASAISSGTGRASSQPSVSNRLRPTRSARPSGGEVGQRLGDTECDDEGENRRPRNEAEVLFADERKHAALEPDHGADERVQADEQAELAPVGAQPQPDGRHARAGLRRAVGGDDRGLVRRRGRYVDQQGAGAIGVRYASAPLCVRSKPIEEKWLLERAAADRAAEVTRVDEHAVRQLEQASDRAVQPPGERLGVAGGVQVGRPTSPTRSESPVMAAASSPRRRSETT